MFCILVASFFVYCSYIYFICKYIQDFVFMYALMGNEPPQLVNTKILPIYCDFLLLFAMYSIIFASLVKYLKWVS